ncbi:hypothetical protein IMZ48_42270, partial [Candidatus Bathyarchaeota archaeon]|nr:hypothetical protein [Candidatus Bathyarchaeota archaeon]
MRAGYQTVPSGRNSGTRGRGTRLRTVRSRGTPVAPEHSTQSQENLASPSPRLPASQIPRRPEQPRTPTAKPKAKYNKGPYPKTSKTRSLAGSVAGSASGSVVGSVPGSDSGSTRGKRQGMEAAPEAPSPSTVREETVEIVAVPESPQNPFDDDKNTCIGDFLPLPEISLCLEDNEPHRAVSCTSTVFFDAQGPLESQPCSPKSPEERSRAATMSNLDALINSFPDPQSRPQTRVEPERTASSNYSNSATLPSPASPASPASPRSPLFPQGAIRDGLPTEVETMRRRLVSYSSDMFKSSTWGRESDLDLGSLGCASPANVDAEGRSRVSSEQATIIAGNRSVHTSSRVASASSALFIAPGQQNTVQSTLEEAPVDWNDGPANASRSASDLQTLGAQASMMETCTITSTQAIKSRTFSSANESELSGNQKPGEVSSKTGVESVSAGPLSSTSNNVDKDFGTTRISRPVAEHGNDGEVEMESQTAAAGGPAAGGVTGWVKRVCELYSPLAVTRSIVR